jgi:hypothetical protein
MGLLFDGVVSCFLLRGSCPTGAAEDGRAPTEERLCVKGLGLLFDAVVLEIAMQWKLSNHEDGVVHV